MHVFRIAKTTYARDLTGTGARLKGGRWNTKGVGVIYTSETRSLAILEFLVHVPFAFLPAGLSLTQISVPNNVTINKISKTKLPKNWRDSPPPVELADLGADWALSQETPLLRVPSVIVEHEYNFILNPLHPDIRKIKISKIEPFVFDDRLFNS